MRSCPSSGVLGALLNGDLEVDRQQVLERHLGECSACQQTLVELAGNASEWDRWGRLLSANTERIAASVVTGIGFLAGGSIIRNGMSVQVE